MAIINFQTDTAGQVNVHPRLVKIVCTDSYATVTALNYLYNFMTYQGNALYSSDIIEVSYGATGSTGLGDGALGTNTLYGKFKPTFTLVNGTYNVQLSEVSGWQNTYQTLSYVNGITAFSTGGQTNATLLTSQINRVTTVAAGNDSVILPVSNPGTQLTVINAAASNSMNVFPQSGDTINALSANTAFALAANKACIFTCAVAGNWQSLLTD